MQKVENSYEKLLEPGYIGNMKLRNRITMSPMGSFLDNPDGSPSKAQIDYYEARARGGVGMVTIEAQYITKTDPWLKHKHLVDTDEQAEGWKVLADSIHAHGAKAAMQLSIGLGRNAFTFEDGQMVSASAVPAFRDPNIICRPLTVAEIHDIVASYGRAAKRALDAGIDCLQIHAHGGYILDQFMTPLWNKRTDEYGGSFLNRMRFIKEAYEAIREVVGSSYPITVRIGAYHDFEGGRTLEESIEIIKYLEELGIDAFDIDLGAYERKQWITPTVYHGISSMAHAAEAIKKVVSVPVINAGTHSPESADQLLREGKIDFAQFGRPLIADPDFPNKLKNNHPEEIRPCIFCTEYCTGNIQQGKGISCAVHPQVNFEVHFPEFVAKGIYPDKKVNTPKKVVVIGGGPAGVEAARAAAERGHQVTIYEKRNQLGGNLNVASKLTYKERLKVFKIWHARQLEKLGVTVHLNSEITENSVELERADQIIVALGEKPFIPDIKGIEEANVVEVVQAHLQPEAVKGENIVIAGGSKSGFDFALELAIQGKNVTVVEKGDEILPDALLEIRNPLTFKLEEYGVNILLKHQVTEFTSLGVKARTSDGNEVEIHADTVIAAFGRTRENPLVDRIIVKYKTAMVLSDSISPSSTGKAVHAGFNAALSIE
ncbi:NAD(P)/FAD-dependent oxidoreductase [Bacillus sp. B15-48]|uniref:NAD(P)/FAD-dependent oxidoreductase n=1 Tax=Bacillus sp. B15-48 TaxID=1548601 RepID=UPI00193ED461|nr:NAD(P)/FAD-dependent oxidoreductase [Bacillus sp. B15-48]